MHGAHRIVPLHILIAFSRSDRSMTLLYSVLGLPDRGIRPQIEYWMTIASGMLNIMRPQDLTGAKSRDGYAAA